MEDNFDPETGECEGGMRNISGDDDDDDADVAFGPLIRTRDERKGVERRGDGQREREREREASTRVWSKYQTPPRRRLCSAPLSHTRRSHRRTEHRIERTLQWPKVTRMERLILAENEMFVRPVRVRPSRSCQARPGTQLSLGVCSK